jgi:probable F420-dependent oxidoreductase
MKIGAFMFYTDTSIGVVEAAQALEARGFESIWVPEHTHIPSSRKTPYLYGGELPDAYRHTLDPYVVLGMIAATTQRIRLGTGISLVVERDPITLAKSVASVDQLSGGRMELGIGGGWNREELEHHGVPFPRRWKVLRERTEAMRAIWTQEEASYQGEFVSFEKIWCWPKPVQQPGPRVWIGGDGANTLRRVVRYGDGWLPTSDKRPSFADKIAELNALAAAAGRGPLPVSVMGTPGDAALLEQYARDGVERCIFWLPPTGEAKVLARMDELARLAEPYLS